MEPFLIFIVIFGLIAFIIVGFIIKTCVQACRNKDSSYSAANNVNNTYYNDTGFSNDQPYGFDTINLHNSITQDNYNSNDNSTSWNPINISSDNGNSCHITVDNHHTSSGGDCGDGGGGGGGGFSDAGGGGFCDSGGCDAGGGSCD